MAETRKGSRWLLVIAAFKLVKAAALIAIGIGALKLAHKDVAESVEHWINMMQIDPDNRIIHRVLEKLLSLDARKLKALSAGTFIYAGLFLTEGTGLALRKRWAEYFTIVVTGSFLPLEIWEIARHPSLPKILAFFVNVAIVIYLVVEVRGGRGATRLARHSEPALE